MPAEGRAPTLRPRRPANQRWEEPVSEAKPFDMPKRLVWDAYQRVKANRGAAGVDGVSLAAFETDLKNNLYKVWNRMASGSYHPPPVRLVEIPKATGGTRPLGIPTVADRVAQTAGTMVLAPLGEHHFHPGLRFERYADDALVHCGSEAEAQSVLEAIRGRLAECGLELHPTKTRVVYCKDDDRPGKYEHIAFDFLGYTFQPRRAKNRWGRYFVSFLPAISPTTATATRQTIRGWRTRAT